MTREHKANADGQENRSAGEQAYREELIARGPFPEGFRAGVGTLEFTPVERPEGGAAGMNMAVLAADEPTDVFAGLFTRSAFPGAPVVLGRRQLDEPTLQGVVINNKVSNVCSPRGLEDARRLADETSRLLAAGGEGSGDGAEDRGRQVGEARGSHPVLSSSTGVIGWALPVEEMLATLPKVVDGLGGATPLDVAEAIMTTDRFPKLRSVSVGEGRILGIAKGAGMVEPNLATMLVFIVTDVTMTRQELREDLAAVVEESFNAISVDGDQSTSDTVLAWSSRRKPAVPRERFREALGEVCAGLAEDIVRNGEGTAHVIRVTLEGAADREEARLLGKAICNSPLVKTAIYGNDPNVGRIIMALGDAAGRHGLGMDPDKVTVSLGEEVIFREGVFHLDRDKESRLCDYLKNTAMDPGLDGYPQHQRRVEIQVDVARGAERDSVLGTDLTHDYIRVNADYRT